MPPPKENTMWFLVWHEIRNSTKIKIFIFRACNARDADSSGRCEFNLTFSD